jgi:hypothetical protein
MQNKSNLLFLQENKLYNIKSLSWMDKLKNKNGEPLVKKSQI